MNLICLDPAGFLTEPGLARQAALKKTKVILNLLSDINMPLTRGRSRWGGGGGGTWHGPPLQYPTKQGPTVSI